MFQFDYNKLRGRIIEKCGSFGEFSVLMGWSLTTQQRKLSGKISWTQRDIVCACRILELEATDIPAYFFTEQVKNLTC